MITVSRQLAKHLRSVFRRLAPRASGRVDQAVHFLAGDEGLRVRFQTRSSGAEFHLPGALPPQMIAVTLESLAACEGSRAGENVTLESRTDDVVLRWQDHSVPRSFVVETPTVEAAAPPLPSEFASNPPLLLTALKEAADTATTDSTRYALNCLQLRGTGCIAATDGSQMLKQSGFTFPWSDDVLVPRSTVFAHRDLPTDQPVQIARTDTQVVIRVGSWTFWFSIEKELRFPRVDDIVPDANSATTKLLLTEADAEYLLEVMPRLPREEESHNAMTVDLNGHVALLAKAPGDLPPTRVVLSNSTRDGAELRWQTDRHYLARAVQLGFREIGLHGAGAPIICQDATRTYVWAPLEPAQALAPAEDMVSLASPISTVAAVARRHRVPAPRHNHSSPERIPNRMSHNRIASTLTGSTAPAAPSEPVPNKAKLVEGAKDSAASQATSFASVLREAEAVKTSLREAHSKVARFISALKRHRKQSKLMQTTLASLKQLQTLDV